MPLSTIFRRGHHGCDLMVVGFTTTYAISGDSEFESQVVDPTAIQP
jgi:hypothetical protein